MRYKITKEDGSIEIPCVYYKKSNLFANKCESYCRVILIKLSGTNGSVPINSICDCGIITLNHLDVLGMGKKNIDRLEKLLTIKTPHTENTLVFLYDK